jgi:hypothetical protein
MNEDRLIEIIGRERAQWLDQEFNALNMRIEHEDNGYGYHRISVWQGLRKDYIDIAHLTRTYASADAGLDVTLLRSAANEKQTLIAVLQNYDARFATNSSLGLQADYTLQDMA